MADAAVTQSGVAVIYIEPQDIVTQAGVAVIYTTPGLLATQTGLAIIYIDEESMPFALII